jgi:carboxyl-terminal processing protease
MTAVFREKAKAAGAVSGNVEQIKLFSENFESFGFLHHLIGLEWFDFQGKTVFAKSVGGGNQGGCIGVKQNFGSVASGDFGCIHHVVEMTMSQKQHGDGIAGKLFIRSLRCIHQKIPAGTLQQVTVGFENASGKSFELQVHVWVFLNYGVEFPASSENLPNVVETMMHKPSFLIHSSILALAIISGPCLHANTGDRSNQGQVAQAVARLLEQGHYERTKLNDEMSRLLFDNYLRQLDYNRLYFTREDIEEFREKYLNRLDDALLRGDLTPAEEIHARFQQRVRERVAKNQELLKKPFDLKTDRTISLNRQEAEWPSAGEEADRLWRDRLKAELIQEHLNEARLDTPENVVSRRYNQILRNTEDLEYEDMVKTFLSALAQSYDPHSDYMSPSDMENFAISMRLSLVGVGAVLKSEDGYAKVVEVVPGGPADLDGRLQVNDRIAAVAQDQEEFEDVVDMKLDKVVEKIRGKKGSTVRLMVVPADASDPAKRTVIDIVRDTVQLKDQEARAELIELPSESGDSAMRLGWITLPSFYTDMNPKPGEPAKSTTEDVSRLLKRLQQEGIEGLVIDLRRDGGGSLDEAVRLTGLFIPPGPVVQAKNSTGAISESRSDSPMVYDGPLVVLMNRLSASASEIFAAALQDYNRAVIVGDERSFGKGTVQQVIDVGRYMPFFSLAGADAGSIKLTVQKFYRVGGGSTQLHGVESDIVLPSLFDNPELGESALQNPMEYDEVSPLSFPSFVGHDLQLDLLRQRSAARVKQEPEFQYILEDIERLRARLNENRVSLNKESRRSEIAADKERRKARDTERKSRGPALEATAWEITLESADAGELTAVAFDREPRKRGRSNDPEAMLLREESATEEEEDLIVAPDPIRNEALLILRDLVDLSEKKKTAKASG